VAAIKVANGHLVTDLVQAIAHFLIADGTDKTFDRRIAAEGESENRTHGRQALRDGSRIRTLLLPLANAGNDAAFAALGARRRRILLGTKMAGGA